MSNELDKRTYLVGCALQGLHAFSSYHQNLPSKAIARDVIKLADACLEAMGPNETSPLKYTLKTDDCDEAAMMARASTKYRELKGMEPRSWGPVTESDGA